MEWSNEFYAWRAGESCPSCAEGRPDATSGVRYFAGERCDPPPMAEDRFEADLSALRDAVGREG